MQDALTIAGREFGSRLFLGTGKYDTFETMRDAVAASGARSSPSRCGGSTSTRRARTSRPSCRRRFSCCRTPRAARPPTRRSERALARAGGLPDWVKLEVIPDPRYLLPDPVETLSAAATLVEEGFTVLPYILPDPVLAKKLEEVGCATVMPLAAPIGSGRGLKLRDSIRIMIEQAEVPVVVDAGLGAPSHAAEAMEMGADAVLVNTAIARADDPVAMARGLPPRGRGRPRGLPRGCDGGAASRRPSSPRRRNRSERDRRQRPRAGARAGRDGRALLRKLGLERATRSWSETASRSSAPRYAEVELEDADKLVVARPVAGG